MIAEEKPREVSALLADALPAAVATLRHLLESPDEPDMPPSQLVVLQVGAARSLLDAWSSLNHGEGRQVALLRQSQAVIQPQKHLNQPEIGEDAVDELMSEVMGAGDGDLDADTSDETAVAESHKTAAGSNGKTAAGKSAPGAAGKSPAMSPKTSPAAPGRAGSPAAEKSPASKTRPRPESDDDTPRVSKKYLITLGTVAALGAVCWLLFRDTTPSIAALAARPVSDDSVEERTRATLELKMRGIESLPLLRKLAAESKDPQVAAMAITGIGQYFDNSSQPLLLKAMDNSDVSVRRAAYDAVLKLYSGTLPENLEYDADGPAEKRGATTRRLQELINVKPDYPGYGK